MIKALGMLLFIAGALMASAATVGSMGKNMDHQLMLQVLDGAIVIAAMGLICSLVGNALHTKDYF